MSSKFIGVMIILTFLLMASAAVFQYLEMRDYQLIEALQERFMGNASAEESAEGEEAEAESSTEEAAE